MSDVVESKTAVSLQKVHLEALKTAATDACNLMRILANSDRLLLLCQLAQQKLCVGEIEELLGIKQPTLSQQLTVLRVEGLVNTLREGKKIYYSMAPGPAMAVMQVLHQQFCPIE